MRFRGSGPAGCREVQKNRTLAVRFFFARVLRIRIRLLKLRSGSQTFVGYRLHADTITPCRLRQAVCQGDALRVSGPVRTREE
ncbi:hypothetical protein CO2235_30045 [Cupriavidus oxalaticus]|uniref:Uncharacterized protein n=1 Tax=Cupriavidus oxalaticus TaxID=96344 RepID=A0A375G9C8_9BURK|nr:hypothetical protein CO2235_30045 [Cupriavidus oxalaticus]